MSARPARRHRGADTDGGTAAQAALGSLVASGYLIFFWMSLTVISPEIRPSSSTTGSFSMRWRPRIACASVSVVPWGR
jgi:hypothetical protein